MKKIALLTALLIIATSCNKIDTSQEVFSIISPVKVTPWDPEYAQTVVRKIYVEEFTGHRCNYCPAGARELEALMSEDPNIVVTAIHCTSLANATSHVLFNKNYKTPMGDIICNDFNIKGLPQATINRLRINETEWNYSPSQWRSTIAGINRNDVKAGIQLEYTIDEEKQEIEAKVAVTIIKEIPNPVQICLILQQDSIISGQLFPNDVIDGEYAHMHMLRAGFNGNYGTRLTPNGIVVEHFKYSTTFRLSYGNSFPYSQVPVIIKNCSVVAYLIDMETKEILQVEYIHLD
ncbi:MAG: Omp28-related outer membrane protein [Bacteroidetes bacterium]|nr:Omp28-related outer membrane protein [Bacteroidota bacterium]MCL2302598.1 Omp28-related outer membrane protein [Lentimicrobiaceae bacterium]